jgi:PqqA peptide cyclase
MTDAGPRLLTLVAELTYACPLRCAYCSNPVQLSQRARPLATTDWLRVLDEAEALGALHVHFTGGEPLLFPDLEVVVRRARERQLYTNLITSGVALSRERLQGLVDAGLEHLQLSFQAATAASNLRIAGIDATAQKLRVARWTKELGIALTVNLVLHRENVAELEPLLALAEGLEPYRIEIANAQYLGWALVNREALLPSAEQLERARGLAAAVRERLQGKTDVLFVLPDYYADRPRACMQGWAQSYLVVTPDGLLLPCQAARDLPGIHFDDVRRAPLGELWRSSPALAKFRGTSWLPEPCVSCDRRQQDFGGCRCQAFALTGDAAAADPACSVTPSHHLVRAARSRAAGALPAPLELRRAPRHRPP